MNIYLPTPTLLPMWTPYIRHINDGDSGGDIVRKTNMTSSHIYKLLYLMEKDGIITLKKEGRALDIRFTEKGNKIRKHIDELYMILGID